MRVGIDWRIAGILCCLITMASCGSDLGANPDALPTTPDALPDSSDGAGMGVSGGFVLVAPSRLLGTATAGQRLAAGQTMEVQVGGVAAVPMSGVPGCDPCTTPDGMPPELQAEMTTQNARITGLATVLQEDLDPLGLAVAVTAPLEATWRRTGDGAYFIVLNLSPNGVAAGTVKVDGIALPEVTVMGESRTVTPADTMTLHDDFLPYEVHVYFAPGVP